MAGPPDTSVGDFAGGLRGAPVKLDATYTTPDQAHAMMEVSQAWVCVRPSRFSSALWFSQRERFVETTAYVGESCFVRYIKKKAVPA